MISQRFVASYGGIIMSTLLLSILGLSIGAQQCTQWREIAPCTCRKDTSRISINCERVSSYGEVVNILQNRFSPTDRVVLRIGSSTLEDLPQRSFKELNMTIENIQLHHDNLSELSAYSFLGLTNVNFLSLSDNNIGTVPEHILEKIPNVKTLDLGRVGIRSLTEENFKSIPYVQNIMLGGNLISQMEVTSIPPNIRQLHLGRNKIKDLNSTLTNLTDLEWVFINSNELTTLENQLPTTAPRLVMIHAAQNKIEKLPQHLKTYSALQSLFIHNNMLTSLDGVLAKLRKLERAPFEHNRISVLTKEDFLETESLQCLCMGNNLITSLNNSLHPLRSLSVLNMTHNLITEFSLQEIKGLQKLRTVDLSYNQIYKLVGPTANLVEWETKLTELILNNNELSALNGALSGLPSLMKLNLSFNKLTQISPDDLIGLDGLQVLDISHNQLTTLEETGKSFLPALNELIASYNQLTVLDRDFHGLPVLCWADLSNNHIVALGRDLVSKTRCKVQDTWGTLKILLQDNPILCDAALPEIVAAMEINHTRISGVSHCGPLSEQPTTSKPNGFLGFIPENSENLYSQPDLNHGFKVNPLYKQPVYQPIPYAAEQQSNNESPMLDSTTYHQTAEPKIPQKAEPLRSLIIENNNERLLNQGDNLETQAIEYESSRSSQLLNFNQPELSNLQQSEASSLKTHQVQTNINQLESSDGHFTSTATNQHNDLPGQESEQTNTYPLPLFETQQSNENKHTKITNQKFLEDKAAIEQPLNEQPVVQHVDPLLQQAQLNMLATQIEQLRLKVEELTVQNKILSNTMNQSTTATENNETRTYESRSITPQEVAVRSLSTEKTPDKLEELATS